jgi:hypothetical protein
MSKNAKLIEIRENEKEILKIAEKASKYLEAEHNIVISHAQAIPTIAYGFLREAIQHINEHKAAGTDYELNLMQLIDLGVSHRENDEAEKEGNYTPYARPGQEFKLLVKDDDDTEE